MLCFCVLGNISALAPNEAQTNRVFHVAVAERIPTVAHAKGVGLGGTIQTAVSAASHDASVIHDAIVHDEEDPVVYEGGDRWDIRVGGGSPLIK